MRLVIVSGLSGAGKTIALQTLEDLDYYCVDNLPIRLLKPLVDRLVSRRAEVFRHIAVGIDARNFLDELEQFPHILRELQAFPITIQRLFLHATDAVLLRRYSDTRRKHPLSIQGLSLPEAIARERQLLADMAAHADLTVDTSNLHIHQLRDLIRLRFRDTGSQLSIVVESFGFKHGVPVDADFVFDVRSLPNPHWEPALRPLTGHDAAVIAFLEVQPLVIEMIADLTQFLSTWIPRFADSNRSYLTIAIGCTGGRHRSVFVAESVARQLQAVHPSVLTRHRDLT